jgi:6-phosphogluconolactonase
VPPLELREVADPAALSRAAADLIAASAATAVRERGRFTLALSGGNTPRALYQLLATEYAHRLAWPSWHLYFGDERCVPPDDAESNYRMADEALLSRIPGLRDRTARIEGERPPADAASHYDTLLRRDFPDGPTFDVALLGLGEDGHTASLFPGSPALAEMTHWAVATEAPPAMKTRNRVTLTYPMFANARTVVFLCAGKDKRDILSRVLGAAGDPTAAYPASRITAREHLMYLADRASLGPLDARDVDRR